MDKLGNGKLILHRHTFVAHSQNVTMTNLDMNATSNSQWNTVNTDGIDTWNSKDVTIKNWVVTCGDVGFYSSHACTMIRSLTI